MTVTVAFGTTAPVESTTVPLMEPVVVVCAIIDGVKTKIVAARPQIVASLPTALVHF